MLLPRLTSNLPGEAGLNKLLAALGVFVVPVLQYPAAVAGEVDINAANAQMEDRIRSLGMQDAILGQMNRKGRSDEELRMALDLATRSLAECMVRAAVDQAQKQGLPATPVLRLLNGMYQGPEDVDDASENDVIRAFDFAAMESEKKACWETYLAEVDTRVSPAEE